MDVQREQARHACMQHTALLPTYLYGYRDQVLTEEVQGVGEEQDVSAQLQVVLARRRVEAQTTCMPYHHIIISSWHHGMPCHHVISSHHGMSCQQQQQQQQHNDESAHHQE